MKRVNHLLIIILSAIIVLIGNQPASAQISFCPLSELKAGMKGYGKTVIHGTEVVRFDVEIIDVVKSGGFDGGDIILGRFSGPVIENSKGIAAGYSGSPVYFNDRLAGAVSGLIPYSDAHVGSITPIENMQKVFEQKYAPGRFSNKLIEAKLEQLKLEFANSPVMISGIGSRGLSAMRPYLSQAFSNWSADFSSAQIASKAGLLSIKTQQPEPGSAIAAMLCEGDIEVSALGTLTHVFPDGRFLAFGHPLSSNGEVDIPISLAYVYHVFSAIDRPFKQGSAISPIGRISTDHLAAVGGKLNENAKMLPVHVRFKDLDRNITKDINFRTVTDPDIYPLLISMSISGKLTEILDRNINGSVSVKSSFISPDLKAPLTFSDYYAGVDPMFIGIFHTAYAPGILLANNSYKDVSISSIDFEVQFTSKQLWAEINSTDIPLCPGVEESKLPSDNSDSLDEPAESSKDKKDSGKNKRSGKPLNENNTSLLTQFLQSTPEMSNPNEDLPSISDTVSPSEGNPRTIKPGTTFKVELQIRPYRAQSYKKVIEFKIPKDFPEGYTMMMIHGGGALLPTADEFMHRTSMFMPTAGMFNIPDDVKSFDETLEYIQALTPNNIIVLELEKPYDPSSSTQKISWSEREKNKIKVTIPTEYVIIGGSMIPIEITSGEEKEPNSKTPLP